MYDKQGVEINRWWGWWRRTKRRRTKRHYALEKRTKYGMKSCWVVRSFYFILYVTVWFYYISDRFSSPLTSFLRLLLLSRIYLASSLNHMWVCDVCVFELLFTLLDIIIFFVSHFKMLQQKEGIGKGVKYGMKHFDLKLGQMDTQPLEEV